MWGAHWTIGLEKRGIPSVYVVDEPFVDDVKITLEKEGMPSLRTVTVPHPCGSIPDEQYPDIIPKLIESLIVPFTEEQKQITMAPKKQGRIAIGGTLDEIQDYYYQHKWSDGLPVIPPTEEKVEEMLRGTSHSSDEIVTVDMWPESWMVTVEKVAIVGVMAGCQPNYLPVLLAIVEAWSSGQSFASTVRSTTSFAFPILVNGPIRNEIGMNAETNALGPGNRANATIGRFLRLAIINLGGSWPGTNDMSSQGNPAKYSFCFPENEERNPWEPFHVSMGYRQEESTVSIFCGCWTHLGNWPQLDLIAQGVVSYIIGSGVVVLLDPLPAKELAEKGMSKQDVEEYIASRAATTKKNVRLKQGHYYEDTVRAVEWARSDPSRRQTSRWPINFLDLPDKAIVRPYPCEIVKVIVVGGGTNSFAQTWLVNMPSIATVDKWR